MDDAKARRIKDAVKRNFDEGADLYDAFEARYGFFGALSEALVSKLGLADHARILDVGCGSGAATAAVARAAPLSRVWGIDISPEMIARAQANMGESDRITFVTGDASELTRHFDFLFDAVLYTASIFLIPDYLASLRQAHALLKPGGAVALSFMDGVYDQADRNSLIVADETARVGMSRKRPVSLDAFLEDFALVFPERETWVENYVLPLDTIAAFFSVPPMSAGLFPGLPYEDRVERVRQLFSTMTGVHRFRWRFIVGQKGRAE
jgi:ubiquinone/menaquinone biosynthesis C-methylase UbiE